MGNDWEGEGGDDCDGDDDDDDGGQEIRSGRRRIRNE